jgi:adenylate cyclase
LLVLAGGGEGVDALTTADMFLAEVFRLDRSGLSRRDQNGTFVPITIGSRALEILAVLVARPGELVTRDEIIKEVWPGTIVEYSNLPVQIAALRRILDRDRQNGSCIQTVAGRGYRFVAPVTSAESVTAASISRSANGAGGLIAADEEPELLSARCPIDGLSPAPKFGAPLRGRRAVIASMAAGAVCLAFIVVAAMNWRSLSPSADGSAPRLSIVVLPFTNLSNDPDQQYFADGITEDLTTDLSRISDMFVISRNTAFTYRNKPVDVKQIGRELGVRYLLEGSVRRSGNQLRVNAELIDAGTDAHLWADRFDRDTGDLFALQNEITSRIGNTLGIELIAAEAIRPTERPDALDYILRGRAVGLKPPSRENFAEQISLFEHALALDPQSVEGQSRLAIALAGRVLNGVTDSAAADLAHAEGLVGQALAASPRYAYAHHTKATVLRAQNRCEEAIPEYETALALNRNMVYAIIGLGWCKVYAGSLDEAIPLAEQAIRLSPRDPGIGWWYAQIGTVHLLQSRTDEAIVWLEQARTAIPAVPAHHSRLAAAYALKGDIERAATELAEARRLAGGNSWPSIAEMKAGGWWGSLSPKTRALHEATFFAGLRKAGVPEE